MATDLFPHSSLKVSSAPPITATATPPQMLRWGDRPRYPRHLLSSQTFLPLTKSAVHKSKVIKCQPSKISRIPVIPDLHFFASKRQHLQEAGRRELSDLGWNFMKTTFTLLTISCPLGAKYWPLHLYCTLRHAALKWGRNSEPFAYKVITVQMSPRLTTPVSRPEDCRLELQTKVRDDFTITEKAGWFG